MARIERAKNSKAGWFARFVYLLARKRLGQLPEPLTITSHHRTLFKGYVAFEVALERSKLVENKLKILAEIKTSSLVGCHW